MLKSDMVVDKRIISRNINKKLLTEKEYEHFLKSLPDDSEEGEPLIIEEESGQEQS